MPKVFISYRRADSTYAVGHIYNALGDRFAVDEGRVAIAFVNAEEPPVTQGQFAMHARDGRVGYLDVAVVASTYGKLRLVDRPGMTFE